VAKYTIKFNDGHEEAVDATSIVDAQPFMDFVSGTFPNPTLMLRVRASDVDRVTLKQSM